MRGKLERTSSFEDAGSQWSSERVDRIKLSGEEIQGMYDKHLGGQPGRGRSLD